MPGTAANRDAGGGLALVSTDGTKTTRLADDAGLRPGAEMRQSGNKVRHAPAAGLLVVRKSKMDRAGEPRRSEGWQGGERASQEAFHVTCAPAVEATPVSTEGKGIGRPLGLNRRNHIHMTGQNNAGHLGRP